MDIDTVEQWPGDALLVVRDNVGRAGAVLLPVAVIATWAGLHGTNRPSPEGNNKPICYPDTS